jgi:2-methylisocitrate lyase-like PEP mutase family enzyme
VFPDVAVGGGRYLSEASRAMKEEALQYAEDYVTEKIEAALSIPSLPDIQELKDKAAAEVDSAKESALAWQAQVEEKAKERFEEAMQRATCSQKPGLRGRCADGVQSSLRIHSHGRCTND